MKKVNSKAKSVKKKRKLFLAILMILFTGVVLTASTYAWFTSNKTVTVDSIDVNVAATEGLQISVDAANWKSIVTATDITGASWTSSDGVSVLNQIPGDGEDMLPVSTVGAIDGSTGYMNFYKGTIDTGEKADGTFANMLVAEKSTEDKLTDTVPNFVAFDLFFQITGDQDTQLYLTSDSNVVYGGTESTGIENASRVAFVVQGHVEPGTNADLIRGRKAAAQDSNVATTADGADNVYIWEPNYDVHTASGVKNALDVYKLATQQQGAAQLAYYGVKAPIALSNAVELSSTSDTYFTKVVPEIATVKDNKAYQPVFSLKAGITKVRVYMWVEGQDVDCEDNASGGSISYNLQFSSKSSSNG